MTIRSLLVPITGQAADKPVLETARLLGETFGAHVAVACLRPDPTVILQYTDGWTSPSLLNSAVAAAEQQSLSMAQKSKALFEQWRSEHGVPVVPTPFADTRISASWSEHVGTAGDLLSDIARFADIVAMRTLGDKGPVDGDLMLEAVLFDAGRPVLLVPRKYVNPLEGAVLVAWDGGREALRAVIAAMPLMGRAKSVQILTVGGNEGTKAEQLAAYLGWHGIAATVGDVSRGSKTIGEVVMREGQRTGASLLVMGGYHHGRTREILFGGTTRQVIAATKIPVLLAH